MTQVTLVTENGVFRAEYDGGAYIDLFWGNSDEPTTVINVFDYAASKPTIPNKPKAVWKELEQWFLDIEEPQEVYEIHFAYDRPKKIGVRK